MRFFYYLTIFIVIFVTAGLVFCVVFPAIQFNKQPTGSLVLEELGSSASPSSIKWIANSNKLTNSENELANLLVFNGKDSLSQEKLSKINGNILIFEQLYSQVSDSPQDMEELNYLTGINYSGFSGATYEDLNDITNIPEKIIQLYIANTGNPWGFFGEGIIITDGKAVLVLRRGIEYKGSVKLHVDDLDMNYQGIFEITDSTNEKKGEISINLLKSGKEMFAAAGLPSAFPALYKINRNLYEAYYFTGNFGSYEIDVPFNYSIMPFLMKNKMIYTRFTNEEVFWRWYYPTIEKIITSSEEKIDTNKTLVSVKPLEKEYFFSTQDQEILQTNSTITKLFYIKGINLGPALPGKYFTEFPQEKDIYLKWFTSISNMNVNTIRIYTLLPPTFYQALYDFNNDNPDPLFLLQEIWPEENPKDLNLLDEDYNRVFHQEIEYVVNAIHGNIQIPQRDFRAFGIYAYDVSPFLLGYLVGREIEPDEVLATDELNKGYSFTGDYLHSLPGITPTESWLAESCDFALTLEEELYNNRPLVAIVSWPTLDPLSHPGEWTGDGSPPYQDKAIVNINHIGINQEKVAGFFGAYHVYPNYPDFMNNETTYANYRDSQGTFRYGGYLQEFMQQHSKYPAVIAEFGISTSSVTAHYNPDGLNHGGLDETQQASDIIRMAEAIANEKYSGAIIFEWMDEWAKKTWTTEYYMIPYDNHIYWHNVLDPEQNYGLLAYEVDEPQMVEVYSETKANSAIQHIAIGQNVEYLEFEIRCKVTCDALDPLSLAISTYSDNLEKEPVYEFLLQLGNNPLLLINPDYNWMEGKYASTSTGFSNFEPMIQITNASVVVDNEMITPEIWQNLSELRVGKFNNNENQVYYERNKIKIRIPYGLMAISDPSTRTILYDEKSFIPTAIDQILTRQIDSIDVQVIQDNKSISIRYPMIIWDTIQYKDRLKDGYYLLAEYFGNE